MKLGLNAASGVITLVFLDTAVLSYESIESSSSLLAYAKLNSRIAMNNFNNMKFPNMMTITK